MANIRLWIKRKALEAEQIEQDAEAENDSEKAASASEALSLLGELMEVLAGRRGPEDKDYTMTVKLTIRAGSESQANDIGHEALQVAKVHSPALTEAEHHGEIREK